MNEEWRPYPGNRRYSVSTLGRVRGIYGRILKPGRYYQYAAVSLRSHNGAKSFLVHRMVLETFVGPSGGLEGNHLNGHKTDNSLKNLEWVTRSENILHSYRVLGKGGSRRGGKNPQAKLTQGEAEEVRDLVGHGMRQVDIAGHYGVDQTTVSRVKRGASWAA